MTERERLECEPTVMLDHLAALGWGEDERLERFIGAYSNQSRHALAGEPLVERLDMGDRSAAGTADVSELSSATGAKF